MRKRVIIIGCLALFIILCGVLLFSVSFSPRPGYRAESLLLLHPFHNALLRPAFRRQVRKPNPGIERLEFQVSPYTMTKLTGTTSETNGIMRLVAAGPTAVEAERRANKAANELCVTLKQLYGISATIVDPARCVSSSVVRKPFRLSFGRATPGPFPAAGRVFFRQAGISLDPGDDWMRHYGVAHEPTCELHLVGEGRFNGGFIHARSLGSPFTNVESGFERLRGGIAQQKGLITSSVKEEPFTSHSGLHGIHASFIRQYPSPNLGQGGMMLMTQATHYYVITNAHSICTVLEYVTKAGGESAQVEEMIRTSLRVD